jgi:Fe2+ transport system protein B
MRQFLPLLLGSLTCLLAAFIAVRFLRRSRRRRYTSDRREWWAG